MSKFEVTYTIEAASLDSATLWGYGVLFVADQEAEKVEVRAVGSGRTFADRGFVKDPTDEGEDA